ncbi:MAG: type IV secretion system protein [Proteobacteria bacterium]|nr:type IV secretion system protein [Pseudomonadota bacterium]
MQILTTAAQSYLEVFASYQHQFLVWGQGIFFSLLTINVVWMCLWYAFDKNSLKEAMPNFIRDFFVITFFYSVMVNHHWLLDLLKTAEFMGGAITKLPIDPSSLISEGISIANSIIYPLLKSSLWTFGVSKLILFFVYLIVLFVFISVALELALTMILTTALISVASFFIGFGASSVTASIARKTLDLILGNCVKLLGIYLVAAVGSQTLKGLVGSIPTSIETLKDVGFDPYVWIVSGVVLFWLVAKNLPGQLAQIVSNGIQETRHTGMGAFALSLAQQKISQIMSGSQKGQSTDRGGLTRALMSTAKNAAQHFSQGRKSSGSSVAGLGKAVVGSMSDLGHSVKGSISDRFKNLSSQLSGGVDKGQTISSVARRMHNAAQDLKSSGSNNSSKK